MGIASVLSGTSETLQNAVATTTVASLASNTPVKRTPSTTIILGGFAFTGLASGVAEIETGFEDFVVVQSKIGGDRVVDVMGQNPIDPSWSGVFYGPDASANRDRIAKLRGQLTTLAWNDQSFNVVVKTARFRDRGPFEIAYSITCVVTNVQSQTVSSTLAQVVSDDVTSANAVSLPDSLSSYSNAFASPKSLLATSGGALSTANATSLLSNLSGTYASVTTSLSEANEHIAGLASLGGESTPFQTVSNLNTAASSLNEVAKLGIMSGYVGRAVNNLTAGGL